MTHRAHTTTHDSPRFKQLCAAVIRRSNGTSNAVGHNLQGKRRKRSLVADQGASRGSEMLSIDCAALPPLACHNLGSFSMSKRLNGPFLATGFGDPSPQWLMHENCPTWHRPGRLAICTHRPQRNIVKQEKDSETP